MQLQEEVSLLKANVMKYKVFITHKTKYVHKSFTYFNCNMYKLILYSDVEHIPMCFISECSGKQEELQSLWKVQQQRSDRCPLC